MKKFSAASLIFILLGITAIGALVANKLKKDRQLRQQQMLARRGSGVLQVDVFVVKPQVIQQTLDASGTLMSNEWINLQPEVSGRITELNFREGSYVKKGTLLVKLFDGDLQAQLQKLQAQLSLQQLTLERQEKLLAINGISQQDVDNTRNQIASIQADIRNVQAQIRKTEIYAPFDGVIGLRNVSLGAIVTPATIIATLQQIDPLKLDFTIPEKYAPLIDTRVPVSFRTAGFDQDFQGRIYAIEPQIDENTRTIRIRCHVPNPAQKLLPGAYADVKLVLKKIPQALMIPTQAIVPTTRDQQVVVYRHGKASFVNVQTGIRQEDFIQVIHGLSPGDTVLITGMMQVRPGVPLHINQVL
ncbi:MAG: efflux RND transporter periplasmic adaptor subunit [Thermoflavifilum aggregans]|nr:efflux RND transporter periplasmic adaptor subunit [Thermoflavifilum aggregans]